MTTDLSKLKLPKIEAPEPPDFGDDEVGRIATFMHEHRDLAEQEKRIRTGWRRSHRKITDARKKTQRAWANMNKKLHADPNMVSIIDNAGLLDALNEIQRLIGVDIEPNPDTGGKMPEPYLRLSVWAADELFPNWEQNPAAKINDALRRADVIDSDKTEIIRVTLQNAKEQGFYEQQSGDPATRWFKGKL